MYAGHAGLQRAEGRDGGAPVAQLDRVSPSEGEGCPFEPGREYISPADAAPAAPRAADEAAMRRAMALADEAAASGDVPIGAVLVVDGRVFEARNEKETRPDPTAHAELLVIRAAAEALGRWRIGGSLYVTKEPCAMCAGALAAARIERLVFGCRDPKGGAAGSVIDILGSAAVNHRVDVIGGVLAEETAAQLRGFFAEKRRTERWSSG
ncbi:MAG: tRNA(adenine34) deaminase [Candidatus Eremiobacteraeota bacterium]|nr:tRNA(adenine34) deaminase [Candidatus Eremiobacteraeota bacterium]